MYFAVERDFLLSLPYLFPFPSPLSPQSPLFVYLNHRSRIRYLSKKIANFNEFSEIKKFVKIRKKFVKCPSGRGLPTTTEEYDAFHGFMLIKI